MPTDLKLSPDQLAILVLYTCTQAAIRGTTDVLWDRPANPEAIIGTILNAFCDHHCLQRSRCLLLDEYNLAVEPSQQLQQASKTFTCSQNLWHETAACSQSKDKFTRCMQVSHTGTPAGLHAGPAGGDRGGPPSRGGPSQLITCCKFDIGRLE